MRILFLGDTVGRSGREAAAAALPILRTRLAIDLAVVNAENASHGFGLAPDMAAALFAAGADVITLGNHAWDRKEIIPYIAQQPRLLRPLNFPPGTPGAGSVLVDVPGGRRALVLNAMGRLYMDPLDCPFRGTADILSRYRLGGTVHAILVDFHAEASSEKLSFGHSFDGQVSVVVGTAHPRPHRRPPDPRPRHGFPIGRRHVRRLRQRHRHGQGGRRRPLYPQAPRRAPSASRGGRHRLRPVCGDRRRDGPGIARRACATRRPAFPGNAKLTVDFGGNNTI